MSWNYTAQEQQATPLKVGDIEPGVYAAVLRDAKPIVKDNVSILILDLDIFDKKNNRVLRKSDSLRNEEKSAFKIAAFCAGYQIDYGAPGEQRSLNYEALIGKTTSIEIVKSGDGQYINIRYNPTKKADTADTVASSDLPF